MPPVQRLVGEGSPREITRYQDEDILNRRIVDIDPDAVGSLVAGSRVLVTGAGGSIGSELVRQLAAFGPATLVALDHDDSLLHHVVASLPAEHRALCTPVLADIRDLDRLHEVFELPPPAARLPRRGAQARARPRERPERRMEDQRPRIGQRARTRASDADVGRVVNISTDKAANPENVLGYTKRIAERLTAASAERTERPLRVGSVRQRDRQPRLGDRDLRTPDRATAAPSRSPIPTSPATSWRYAKPCGSRCRPPPSADPARCSCSTWARPCASSTSPAS